MDTEPALSPRHDPLDIDAAPQADPTLTMPEPWPPRREWDRPPALPALGLTLLGLLWLVFLVWPRPPADDSADAGFLRDMITHHAQAVQMGQITDDTTTDPTVDILAGDIATTQQAQVGIMLGWLDQWDLLPNNAGPAMTWMGMAVDGLMPGMATEAEIDTLLTLSGPDLDVAFLRMMTRHHLGGADMANACLAVCVDDEVIQLARDITISQGGEIILMNELLVARGQPAVTAADIAMPGMDMPGMAMGETSANGAGPARLGPSDGETIRSVASNAVRVLPALFGLIALVWLVVDSLRRRGGLWEAPGITPASSVAPVLAGIGAATVSAALHAGLVPGMLDVRPGLGLFHILVVVVQAAVIAWIVAGGERRAALTGAVVGIAIIATWALVRLMVSVGDEIGRFDLAITLTIIAEAIQVAAFLLLWRTQGHEGDPQTPATSHA